MPQAPGRNLSAVRFSVAMNILKKPILEDRWAQMRTHKRVISRVKFLVEWDEDSHKQRANAVTVDVSHSGCMAIVGAPLPLHKQRSIDSSRNWPQRRSAGWFGVTTKRGTPGSSWLNPMLPSGVFLFNLFGRRKRCLKSGLSFFSFY